MITSQDLFHELTEIVAKKAQEILGKAPKSSSHFKSFDFRIRANGILLRPNDDEFTTSHSKYVPELNLFLEFVKGAKSLVNNVGTFAFLDYHLPPDFYNALYLTLDNGNGFEKYAERLNALYQPQYKDRVDKIIFDSNKVMTLCKRFAPFVISCPRQAVPSNSGSAFDLASHCHEYYITLDGFNELCGANVLAQLEESAEVDTYVNKLENLYTKLRNDNPQQKLDRLKGKTSDLVQQAFEAMTQNPKQKVGEIDFDDIPAAFLTYLAFVLTITPTSWVEYIYYPYSTVVRPKNEWAWIGGILLPYSEPTEPHVRVAFQNATGHVVSTFYLGYTHALLNEQFLRSSSAAIMARNMSHLLGSHIEPGIQNDILSFLEVISTSNLWQSYCKEKSWNCSNYLQSTSSYPLLSDAIAAEMRGSKDGDSPLLKAVTIKERAIERYASYRQRRMDFVARVATSWPAWGAGFDFYKMFVEPFLGNSILLHFAGYSDGFSLINIDFEIRMGNKRTKQKVNGTELTVLELAVAHAIPGPTGTELKYKAEPTNYLPVTIWSRGGHMAVQAFQVILENILRNSIKHSTSLRSNNKDFKIGVFFHRSLDQLKTFFEMQNCRLKNAAAEYYYVVVSSDADEPGRDGELVSTLDSHICRPVIDEQGGTDPEAWGQKEIKIAAAFIANRELEACNQTSPDYVQVGVYNRDDQKKRLGYCFLIPRYYYLGEWTHAI